MPRLTVQQRVWICIKFIELNRNSSEVRRQWMAVLPDISPPQVKTIIKTFRKFENEGTCIDLNK